jgi:hypothetical protein
VYLLVQEKTVLSAQVLESALRHGLYKGWLPEEAAIRDLVESYADRAPQNAWNLTNALGELGFFDLENLARSLRDVDSQASGSREILLDVVGSDLGSDLRKWTTLDPSGSASEDEETDAQSRSSWSPIRHSPGFAVPSEIGVTRA